MADNLFCGSCRQFLSGTLPVIHYHRQGVKIIHHDSLESLEKALLLPCTICTMAYRYDESQEHMPWSDRQTVHYEQYTRERHLTFKPNGLRLMLVPEADLSQCTINHDLSSSTKSDSAVSFITNKYDQCHTRHTRCSAPKELTTITYPSRLLDVGTDGNEMTVLRGIDTCRDTNMEYACLSHCWGTVKPYNLNKETELRLTSGISIGTMPKTFRDAIHITQLLRIRCLWIDSLCIRQDSEDDRAAESARMGAIYSRASCTIAASASLESNGGLFFDRSPHSFQPRLLPFAFPLESPWLKGKAFENFRLSGTYLCEIAEMTRNTLDMMPLYQRAWVSQERQLSRRLLHFTKTQLFWECYECLACETYSMGIPGVVNYAGYGDVTKLKTSLDAFTRRESEKVTNSSSRKDRILYEDIYSHWDQFRYRYSGCQLTYATDKLVAIQGIANWVGRATWDKLVTGLWENRIIQDLCWSLDSAKRSGLRYTDWIAPTWSWASCSNATMSSILNRYHRGHRERNDLAEVIELKIESKTSGALERASMTIKCTILQALFTPTSQLVEIQDRRCDGLLELYHQGETMFRWAVSLTAGPSSGFVELRKEHPDDSLEQRQDGYVALMQQCLHDSELRNSGSIAHHENVDQIILTSDEEDEYTGSYADIKSHDWVEALFLQATGDVESQYERMGVLKFTKAGARAVLQARRAVDDTIITII